MRKKYGTTWWGMQWLQALSEIDYSNRLPRGRTYANKGMVSDVEINNHHITANVSGAQSEPYAVTVTIPTFSKEEKAKVLQLITDNPAFLSNLLNRQLPPALSAACEAEGIAIFPEKWSDLQGSCSCPDWAVPCKHLAATLYIIANEIDKNPFLIFSMHGFDLFQALQQSGYTQAQEKEVKIPHVEHFWQSNYEPDEPFTFDELSFQAVDFTEIPNCFDQIMTVLGTPTTFFPEGDFSHLLSETYRKSQRLLLRQEKKMVTETKHDQMDAVEDIALVVDEHLDFKLANIRDRKGKSLLEITEFSGLLDWLHSMPVQHLLRYSNDLKGLFLTHRFARFLVINSAFIPQLISFGHQQYRVRWIPALLNDLVRQQTATIEALTPPHLLYRNGGDRLQTGSAGDDFINLLSLFISHYVNEGFSVQHRYSGSKVGRLFFNGSVERFTDFTEREYATAIQLWLNKFYLTERDFVPVFQVEETEEGFELKIAINDKTSTLHPLIPLDAVFADSAHRHLRLAAMRALSTLSAYFPAINALLASKGTKRLIYDAETFVDILFHILPTIRLFGVEVMLPKTLRKLIRPKLSLSVSGENGNVATSSIISLENMLRFNWQVAIGEQSLSTADFLKMVNSYSGIVKIKDSYVYFDEKEIEALIEKLAHPPTLTSHELLQSALTEEYEGGKISLDPTARQLLHQLLDAEVCPPPEGLRATLRPYQLRGYSWLYKNTKLGLGSLLADDMGLGKTLQVIATLLKLKEEGAFATHKALIIVPTTLLTNWQKEIQKFAPSLRAHVFHGASRSLEGLATADLLITTYGVARSEENALKNLPWLVVVIDEAQAIKNPGTAQTKAIKNIPASIKIAMSGTPVENRLSEYWSVMDFSNKGYLGSLTHFKDTFAKPIELNRDQQQLDKFRKITEPFILRRLKSDKSIIQDLPPKIVTDQYCRLTHQQAALYQQVVDTTMKTVAQADGIQRKGLILKLITALKQICNHPAQFLKRGNTDAALSGKSQLLIDLLHPILERDEKTLIFTQYQSMGKLLVEMLAQHFNFTAAFLHGGVSRKIRDEMVEDFQQNRNSRVLILSLKAGGTGLNLTAASNVIHYDLWWNPAVENQATDRAYRIGQQKRVMVYRFITENTFEEKINQLLHNKRELADLTVATGERWIGELSNEELNDIVTLGKTSL